MDNEKKINELAQEILIWAKSTLIVNLRFIDSAINALELRTYIGKMATNARNLYYDPFFVLKKYKSEPNTANANYMHILLHCVFRHYKTEDIERPNLWNLACDITVENMIGELNIPCLELKRQGKQRLILEELKNELGMITAKKLYRYYEELDLDDGEIENIHKYFYVDEHYLWYQDETSDYKESKGKEKKIEYRDSTPMNNDALKGEGDLKEGIIGGSNLDDETDEIWESISKKMQVNLETFSKNKGGLSGSICQNLKVLNRQKYDYSQFLRKFASLGEDMKLNDQEFDYIFYSYGLELYGNVPLIEPLEYKEEYSIKEFVIAIDTSASVSGELVQRFLEKTYNILNQEESFSRKINLRIMQCDACIQEDVKITSKAEFDRYIKTMSLKGFGCTDFRPVFERVEKLREENDLKDLKGLIYFTDGQGSFPAKKPNYKTAFVFLDDNCNSPEVPVWAIKLVLERGDI